MNKPAVILAGGKGTRLLPYTVSRRSRSAERSPIRDRDPALDAAGFDSIALAVNHQADLIRAYFGDGAKWRVHIDYSLETMLRSAPWGRYIVDRPENFLG